MLKTREEVLQTIQSKCHNSNLSFVFTNSYYYTFVLIIISFCLYSLVKYSIVLNLFAFITAYFWIQTFFMGYHVYLHCLFKESNSEHLRPGPYIAFVHHYKDPRLLCSTEHTRSYNSPRALIPMAIYFLIPSIWGSTIDAIVFGSWCYFWWLTVPAVHEYYHLPRQSRSTYFNPLTLIILETMNKLKIINIKTHYQHHSHREANCVEAHKFDDSWVPLFMTVFFDKYWKFLNKRIYVKGKNRMSHFALIFTIINGLAGCMLVNFISTKLF